MIRQNSIFSLCRLFKEWWASLCAVYPTAAHLRGRMPESCRIVLLWVRWMKRAACRQLYGLRCRIRLTVKTG